MDGNRTKISLTVVKATGLPSPPLGQKPTCCAKVIADDFKDITAANKSKNPEWDETFEFTIDLSTIIKVQVIRISILPFRGDTILGEVTIPAANLLDQLAKQPGEGSVTSYELQKAASRKPIRKGCTLEIVVRSLESAGNSLGLATDNTSDLFARSSSNSIKTLLEYLQNILAFSDPLSQIHPVVGLTLDILQSVHKIFFDEVDREKRIQDLWGAAVYMLAVVNETASVSRTQVKTLTLTISTMVKQIYECAVFVRLYKQRSYIGRALEGAFSSSAEDAIKQFKGSFRELRQRFQEGVEVSAWKIVQGLRDETILLHQALKGYRPPSQSLDILPGKDVTGYAFNEGKVCHPGTRQKLVNEITDWIHDEKGGSVLWLTGVAGSGKSTVANTVAAACDELKRLGGSFCFNRDRSANVPLGALVGRLAYALAVHSPSVRQEIMRVIDRYEGTLEAYSLLTLAHRLIIEPTSAANLVGPVVLVVDALDESGTVDTREPLLQAIASFPNKLGRAIKVLITSRDEPDIRRIFHPSMESITAISMNGREETPADIRTYLHFRISRIKQFNPGLEDSWTSIDTIVDALAKRAQDLFIWAEVSCSFIERGDPASRLEQILEDDDSEDKSHHNPSLRMRKLYLQVLENIDIPCSDHDFRYVLGAILLAKTPLTQVGLDSLLELNIHGRKPFSIPEIPGVRIRLASTASVISSLRPILLEDTNAKGENATIRILHPSLFEFLTGQDRRAGDRFSIDKGLCERILAMRCFSAMNTLLKRDICDIRNPTKFNSEVSNIHDCCKKHFPEHLQYSCRFWSNHVIEMSNNDQSILTAIREFFMGHFLHWLEAMSLLGLVNEVYPMLQMLQTWCQGACDDIYQCLDEALRFVMRFHVPITQSALHVYVSGLAFCRKENPIQRVSTQVAAVPRLLWSTPVWPNARAVCEGHHSGVYYVKFADDGKQVISVSSNLARFTWDMMTGTLVGEPLQHYIRDAHKTYSVTVSPDGTKLLRGGYRYTALYDSKTVESVSEMDYPSINDALAFSPDGELAASGWLDGMILVNDVSQNYFRHIATFQQKSRRRVPTLAFSPNQKYLVSGDDDGTIEIWDASEWRALGDFHPHAGGITSVAVSSDSAWIASGSSDGSIHIWDVKQRATYKMVMIGHMSATLSLAFSPNGDRIVSASHDTTLRVWNVQSGELVGYPLRGHIGPIQNVAFSSDGRCIVSGSHDRSVRIWDAEALESPPKEHPEEVTAVAFSRDGTKLALGSFNHSLQILNMLTGKSIRNRLGGHHGQVTSIAFSPQEHRMASGSSDLSIRIWDTEKELPISSPLTGHETEVKSILFTSSGSHIITRSAESTRTWDAAKGTAFEDVLQIHTDKVIAVAFSHNGHFIASASVDGTVRIVEAGSRCAFGSPLVGHTDYVTSVAISPDEAYIISSSLDTTIRRWELATGKPVGDPLRGHTDSVRSVVFSADGKRMASGSSDTTIRIWSAKDGMPIGGPLRGHTDRVVSVAFSPKNNDQVVSASYDGTISIWDITTSTRMVIPPTGQPQEIRTVSYSPDGHHIASAINQSICFWDAGNCKEIGGPLIGHTDRITSIAFSQDGSKMVSGSQDRTIQVWDVARRIPLGEPLYGHTEHVRSVAFSPAGDLIVSGSNDGTVRLWDATVPIITETPLRETPQEDGVASSQYRGILSDASRVRCHNKVAIKDDGWLCGNDGTRLLWIPPDERGLWQPNQPGLLVLGRDSAKITVVEMEEYVNLPEVNSVWCYGDLLGAEKINRNRKAIVPPKFRAMRVADLDAMWYFPSGSR